MVYVTGGTHCQPVDIYNIVTASLLTFIILSRLLFFSFLSQIYNTIVDG